MKEKIDRLAKGVFSYDLPELVPDKPEIRISVEKGKKYSGFIVVSNIKHTSFKGVVYSSLSYLTFPNNTFSGTDNRIDFVFDAAHLDVYDTFTDSLVFVTECGELMVPVDVKVIAPSCVSSDFSIKDSFQLTNLAKSDFREASELFCSDEFADVIKYYDQRSARLRRFLSKNENHMLALEEYLVAVRKKRRIVFSSDRDRIELRTGGAAISGSFTLKKDTWGYGKLKVLSDAPFIHIRNRFVDTELFSGDSLEIVFDIDPIFLHGGRNFGRILLVNPYTRVEVEVVCLSEVGKASVANVPPYNKSFLVSIINTYTDYRLGNLSSSKFSQESAKLLKKLDLREDLKYIGDLYRIYTLISDNKISMANTLFETYADDERLKEEDITVFGAITLFEGLLSNNAQTASDSMAMLRNLAERDGSNLLLFLFICLADRKNKYSSQRRFDDMRRLYERGVRSRVLYAEALMVMNAEPQLLKSLGEFECQVLRFGARKEKLEKGVVLQLSYLCEREKAPSEHLCRLLREVFRVFRTKELLETICTVMINRNEVTRDALVWYRLAIEEQVSNPGLYEMLLKATRENEPSPEGVVLPPQVFAYFSLNHELEDRYRAFLYANLICHKSRLSLYYQNYKLDIKEFAESKLRTEELDPSLSVIFEDVFADEQVDPSTAERLCRIAFLHEVRVSADSIVTVGVVHKELEQESIYPVSEQKANVDIYTEDYELFFFDAEGNRYSSAIGHRIRKLVEGINLKEYVREELLDDRRALLNTYDGLVNEGLGDSEPQLMSTLVSTEGLMREFVSECRRRLIYYYYDEMKEEKLEEQLVGINLSDVSGADRKRILEIMHGRELFNLSLNAMLAYGFEGMDVKKLLMLCTRLIPVVDTAKHGDFFEKLCFYIFQKGKYNDTILGYLVKYYNGSVQSMYDLWEAAEASELDAASLEERIVAQLLFTESDRTFARAVFKRYYLHGPTPRLVKAFLSYYAFGYLRDEKLIDTELMQIMKRELVHNDSKVMLLALLKGLSRQKSLSEEELEYVERNIARLTDENSVLPFFKDFLGKVKLPAEIYDRCYIEYHSKPSAGVVVHYQFEDSSEDYLEKQMTEVCCGIYIAEFVMFYGEGLQYYIVEQNEEGCSIGESFVLRLEPEFIGGEETKYHMLNLIITAKEMNDDKTVLRILETYLMNEYRISRLFKPL